MLTFTFIFPIFVNSHVVIYVELNSLLRVRVISLHNFLDWLMQYLCTFGDHSDPVISDSISSKITEFNNYCIHGKWEMSNINTMMNFVREVIDTVLLTWESGWPRLTGVSSCSQGAPPSNQVHGLTLASFERFPRRCPDLQLANQIPPWHEVHWMAWWCCGGDLLTGFGWWLPARKVSEAGEISFVL